MPKRVIDGEALWRSDKLSRVEPAWVRSEYANLIPLALANGVFESDAKRIWSQVYSYNRPYMGIEEVKTILAALERARLLFRWRDASGKEWGYWTNSDKPGRLPPASHRARFVCGPEPPQEELRQFLAGPSTEFIPTGVEGLRARVRNSNCGGNNHKSGVAPESLQLGIGCGMDSGRQGSREAEEAKEINEVKEVKEVEEGNNEWSEVVGNVRYYYAGDAKGYRRVVRVERIAGNR
jgi:hypothetical protein